MRLFIAIKITEDIKEYLAKIQEKLDGNTANKIKCVNKDQIHLTLKFLGEVQPDKVEEIKNNIKKIIFVPFSAYLDKIGVFPSENYIRVVWVGLKPEEPILEIQKGIDENLKKLFKKEKSFKSHLTLARVKFIDDKKKFVDKLRNIKIENKKMDISCFKLIKSTLTPQGPIYEDLEVFGK
jgi:2'-5' RNA ligase|tara:strand:- start:6103 stop:6642 length:540 start_codon:yes stop_codon:yes gene_type:complete